MIYILLFIPLALALVAFQSTVLNQITIAGGHFDFLTVFLVFLTLYGSYELALASVVVLAPIADAISGLPIGVSVVPMISIVLLAHWGGKTIFGARLGWPVVVIVLGVLVGGLLTMLELILLGWNMPWDELILRSLLPSAMLSGVAALLIYMPIILFSERREYRLE
ncbi:MAG TPA: hypothetical protein ENK60_01210 [Anaerolineae bacterium]|nr:hypothetical protein [Anaerolineae bacterium]